MAERAGLLNRYTGLNLYRGFESLPLRRTDNQRSGRSVARLSRLVWDQEVASSNLAAPTNIKTSAIAEVFCIIDNGIINFFNFKRENLLKYN